MDATSEDPDAAGAGVCHGAGIQERERFAGQWENPASESSGLGGDTGGRKASEVAHELSGVGEKEGGRKASGVAENPRGDLQVVGGEVEFPRGIDAPGVE